VFIHTVSMDVFKGRARSLHLDGRRWRHISTRW